MELTSPSILVHIDQFPNPPSTNLIYKNAKKGRRKTDEYVAYENKVALWSFRHRGAIERCKTEINEYLARDPLNCLEVVCIFSWHKKRIISAKGSVKRIDPSNYLKALHDKLSDVFDIDDRLYQPGQSPKVWIDNNEKEHVEILIFKDKIKSKQEFMKGIANGLRTTASNKNSR